MRKILFLFLLLPAFSFAQRMELRNPTTGKIINLPENCRVKVVANGHVFRGKMHLVDTQHFFVGKKEILLSDVTEIKPNGRVKAITGGAVKTAGLISGGTTLDKAQKHHSRTDWSYRIIL